MTKLNLYSFGDDCFLRFIFLLHSVQNCVSKVLHMLKYIKEKADISKSEWAKQLRWKKSKSKNKKHQMMKASACVFQVPTEASVTDLDSLKAF